MKILIIFILLDFNVNKHECNFCLFLFQMFYSFISLAIKNYLYSYKMETEFEICLSCLLLKKNLWNTSSDKKLLIKSLNLQII